MAISNLFTVDERVGFQDAITRMKERAKTLHPASVKAAIIAMRDRPSYQQAMASLGIPITYVAGRDDQIIPLELIKADCDATAGKMLVLESGHMSILTHVEEVGHILL